MLFNQDGNLNFDKHDNYPGSAAHSKLIFGSHLAGTNRYGVMIGPIGFC
jgi:hypothetical protein